MQRKSQKGFTLIEALLAMTVGACVLTALMISFKGTYRAWNRIKARSEMAQHLRVCMNRMMSDLRYAEKLNTITGSGIQFDTRYLVDDDSGVEEVRYQIVMMGSVWYLERSVDGGVTWSIVGGSIYDRISVVNLVATGLKKSAGNLDLIPLAIPPDTYDMADAVRVELTATDAWMENTFFVTSTSKLMNK